MAIVTVPYIFTVASSDVYTQQTRAVIEDRYRVIRLKAVFPSGMQNQVKVYFYSSTSSTATTAKPSGTNLLATPQSPSSDPYLTGDNVFLVIDNFTEVDDPASYLSVYASNADASNSYEVQAFIEYQDVEDTQ